MTVHERDCCYLLYKYLRRDVYSDEISEKTINCGMNTYLQYKEINQKMKNNYKLTEQEKLFYNYFLYDNEVLLILLGFEFNKLIAKTTKEIGTFIKLFDNYNDSIEVRNNVYFYRPFKYDNFDYIKIILSKLYNFDIKIDFYEFVKLFLNGEELMNNYNVLLKDKEKFDFNKCKRKIL